MTLIPANLATVLVPNALGFLLHLACLAMMDTYFQALLANLDAQMANICQVENAVLASKTVKCAAPTPNALLAPKDCLFQQTAHALKNAPMAPSHPTVHARNATVSARNVLMPPRTPAQCAPLDPSDSERADASLVALPEPSRTQTPIAATNAQATATIANQALSAQAALKAKPSRTEFVWQAAKSDPIATTEFVLPARTAAHLAQV